MMISLFFFFGLLTIISSQFGRGRLRAIGFLQSFFRKKALVEMLTFYDLNFMGYSWKYLKFALTWRTPFEATMMAYICPYERMIMPVHQPSHLSYKSGHCKLAFKSICVTHQCANWKWVHLSDDQLLMYFHACSSLVEAN